MTDTILIVVDRLKLTKLGLRAILTIVSIARTYQYLLGYFTTVIEPILGTDKTEDKTHSLNRKPTFRVNHSIRSSFI